MSTVAELYSLSPCGTDISATDILTTGDQRSSDTQRQEMSTTQKQCCTTTTVLLVLLVLVVCRPLSSESPFHFDAADI